MVRVFNAHPKHRIRRDETLRLVRRVLKGEGPGKIDLNIVYIDDHRMIGLNRKYLNHGTATDVLSFSLNDVKPGVPLEGEVYVNLDQARRQAIRFNETIRNEVARLVIHGILHLVGYDDASKRQKKLMTRLEDAYLGR